MNVSYAPIFIAMKSKMRILTPMDRKIADIIRNFDGTVFLFEMQRRLADTSFA